MKAIKLIYNDIKIDTIKRFLKPSYIYIPIKENYKVLVKKDSYIYKGQPVIEDSEGFKTHSSVSGLLKGRCDYKDSSNNTVRCLVIENDYKELYENKISVTRDISKYTKEQFINIIKEAGIVGLGGAGYQTYKKYILENQQYLVVNAVECEPLIKTDKGLIKDKIEEILECIDAITEIMDLKKSIIVVKTNNEDIIEIINQYKGTYLNIDLEIVDNKYPNGWERKIVHDVLKLKYKNYPSEVGVIVNNVSTIYAMYEALKYKKPLIEKIVTITGNNIVNPNNCLVKIGTSLNEIIPSLGGLIEEGNYLISGSVMTGKVLTTLDTTIEKHNNCFLCQKDKKNKLTSCIKCGKCSDICPVGLSPVLIRQNLDNPKMLEKLGANRCISCGLCSYVCVAKIEIKENVQTARKRV